MNESDTAHCLQKCNLNFVLNTERSHEFVCEQVQVYVCSWRTTRDADELIAEGAACQCLLVACCEALARLVVLKSGWPMF